MDKKYFTNRVFLVSGIALIMSGIVMFCIPLMFSELDDPLMTVPFYLIGLLSVFGVYFVFRAACYPVLKNDRIVIKNVLIASRTREIMYSEINYATVNKYQNGKGNPYLQIHIGLKCGENLGYSIMTEESQLEELRNELKSHGVSDEPCSVPVVKSVVNKVYKSNAMVVVYALFMLMLVGTAVGLYFAPGDDLGVLCLGAVYVLIILYVMWISNYVIVDHGRIELKNVFCPFRNNVIYFSDIEKAEINDRGVLVLKLKSGEKDLKRSLGLLSPILLDELRVGLKVEIK